MLNHAAFLNRLSFTSFMCNPLDVVDLFYNKFSCDVTCIIDDLIPMTVETKQNKKQNNVRISPLVINLFSLMKF